MVAIRTVMGRMTGVENTMFFAVPQNAVHNAVYSVMQIEETF
jgi:hypothetical protein